MYLIYNLLLALGLLLTSPWWLIQALRHGKYRAGLQERLGFVPERLGLAAGERRIWVHAVSVGEVLAISRLVHRMREQFPQHRVLVSTTTLTGQMLARQRFGAENVFYFPLDFDWCVWRWINAVRPELVVLAETEFWPAFLHRAKRSGAHIAVVNARISDHSLPRYFRFRRLLRLVLQNVDAFAAQSAEDARRLVQIGAAASAVEAVGNLKFEVSPPAEPDFVAWLRQAIAREHAGPVIVAGSTVDGEEAYVMEAFSAVLREFAQATLVLAPRHKERFESIAQMLRESRLPVLRRSLWRREESAALSGSVLLLDSIGELASVYALADVAFVGGSLVPRGGHNILEAAQFGAPVVTGPHTENFRDIMQAFKSENAVVVVAPDEFAARLLALLKDDAQRETIGTRGMHVVQANSGATERTLAILGDLLNQRRPS